MTRQEGADAELRDYWAERDARRRRALLLAWCEDATACACLCLLIGALCMIPGVA